MNKVLVFVILAAILSIATSAEVMISEIMYDPYGTETKKEWIELYNAGSETVNITEWKIKDGATTRPLNLYAGSFVIEPDSFAVIARNGENFTDEYTFYVGTIIESSFSLTNSGKELYLLNGLDEIIDNVNYTDISDEGYSIEINDSTSDNSLIENWIPGILNGDPGNIKKREENNGNNGNTVPEFNLFGTVMILTFGIVMVFRRKK